MIFRWLRARLHRRQKTYLLICACAIVGVLLLHELVQLYKGEQLPSYQPPLQWEVSQLGRNTEEVHHLLFVKVHKAASSTLTSLFIRFSLSRRLNVMFPRATRNILSERMRWPLATLSKHPPSPPFLFDILCNHLVYDRHVEKHFPSDLVRVAILRKPLSQVYSAFNYYRTVYIEDYLTKPPTFRDFVSKQRRYEHPQVYQSFTNNRMALDLGLPQKQLKNSSHVRDFVQEVDDLFHLVLITERFNESMVLLKRRLKWTMKDVLYISINKRTQSLRDPPELSPPLEQKFRQFQQFDYALYDHFSEKFDKLVREEGADFQDEVRAYRAILQRVNKFCCQKHVFPGSVEIPDQKYTGAFELQSSECETMMLGEMDLNERARFWQEKRLYPEKRLQFQETQDGTS